MTALHIQFWTKRRGLQDVFIETRGQSADRIARLAVDQAAAQFAKWWPFPDYDRKAMICTGLTDGFRWVIAKDVPASSETKQGTKP